MQHKIIAAGGVVFNEHEELLMIHRRGYWDLPKGKLDEGETIEECALREVQEETGIMKVELRELVAVTSHEYFDRFLNTDVVKETHWYNMRSHSEQALIPQAAEDITDIKWVPKNEIHKYAAQSYKNIQHIILSTY